MSKHAIAATGLALAWVFSSGCGRDCIATAPGVCEPVSQSSGSTAGGSDGGTDGGSDGGSDGGTATYGGGVSGFEAYGTTPNGGHISLDCTPNQTPAFAEHDCLYSHYQDPETVKCTLTMADRHGVVIGVARLVHGGGGIYLACRDEPGLPG